MTDYAPTRSRIFQWMGIMLALGIIAVGYWLYKTQASTINQSQNSTNTTGLVGLWSFNGDDISGTTAYDRSGSGNNGTLTGGPTKTTGQVGQALSFDGSDDYVALTDIAFGGTDPISICFWANPTSLASSQKVLFAQATEILFRTFTTGQVEFILNSFTTNDRTATNGAVLTVGSWTHICGTYTSGGSLSIYANGRLETSVTPTGTYSNVASNFEVASGAGGGGDYFPGKIDEVRIYNRALPVSEIAALYSQGQSDKTNSSMSQSQGTGRLDSGLNLYWPFDNGSGVTATDVSTNGNNGTLTCFGALCSPATWTTGQIGSAVELDGSQDYAAVSDPSSGVLDFADSRDFTITGWFNRDTFAADHTILAKRNGVAASDVGYLVFIDASGDHLYFEASDGTDEYSLRSSAINTYTASGWHHFAIVWNDSSASETKLYINGFLDTAVTAGTFANVGSLVNAVDFRVGAESDNGNPYDGKIDEVRLYSRALSGDEVTQLYRLTTPTGVDTSLKGYWSFNGQDVSGTSAFDRSGSGNTGTINGTTRTPGILGQALSFDGSGDYVDFTDVAYNALTFSVWFYTTNNSQTGIIFGEDGGSSAAGPKIGIASGNFFVRLVSSSDTSVAVPTAGKWHHLVVTRDGSNKVDLYLNGGPAIRLFSDAAQSGSYDLDTLGDNGGSQDQGFTGKLDEFRIYNTALSAAQIKALYDAGQSDKSNSSVSQSQGTGRLDSGLKQYWRMDEGTGSSTSDSSTNAYTGTLTDGPTWSTGQIGGAITFDGTDDYVATSDTSPVPNRGTIAFWVNTTASINASRNYSIYVTTTGPSQNYIAIYFSSFSGINTWTAYWRGAFSTSRSQAANTYASNGTLQQWQHVVFVWDVTTRGDFYVNGVLQAPTAGGFSSGTTGSFDSGTYGYAIGRDINFLGSDEAFPGQLDEFRLYDRVLSVDEISQLYRLTAPTGVDTGLKGYWSFNGQDVSGTTAYDRSGAGNTGTLSGPTKTAGKVGQALSFDGTNDEVTVGDINAMDGVANVTLSAWMKRSAANAHVTVGKSVTANQRFDINFYSDGNVYLNINDGASQQYGYFASNDTNWHYVVMVFDGSQTGNTNRLKAYVDGVATSLTFSGTIPATTHSNSDSFVIGRNSVNGFYSSGKIDEVRLYNRSLTEAEAYALYNQGR